MTEWKFTTAVTLADGTNSGWIHIMSPGTIHHPRYGELAITEERLRRYAQNVNDNVRGIELAVDYHHNKEDKAAGWIRKAEVRPSGLWGFVDWNDPAAQAIRNGEYKYISADFTDEWTTQDGKATYKDVLLGAALTNRPFLKTLQPVNLEEFVTSFDEQIEAGLYLEGIELRDIPQSTRSKMDAADFAGKDRSFPIEKCEDVSAAASSLGRAGPNNYDTATLKSNTIRIAKRKGFTRCLPKSWQMEEGGVMDPKELAKALGLSEDVDEATILAKVKEVKEASDKKLEPTKLAEAFGIKPEEATEEALVTKAKELSERDPAKDEAKRRKFAEDYPDEAKRLEESEKTSKEMAEKAKKSAVQDQVKSLIRDGVPAASEEALTAILMSNDLSEETSKKLNEVLGAVAKTNPRRSKETGSGSHDDQTSAKDQLTDAAKKLQEANKEMTWNAAWEKALSENPELAKEYAFTDPKEL